MITSGSHFISEIYKMMSDQKIILTYLGDVTPEITNAILKAIKTDDARFNNEVVTKKKVYKIIVECLENITRHSERVERKMSQSIFLLGRDDDNYYIITGNYIYGSQVDSLKSVLNEVNNMNKEQIKDKYREILNEGKISEKGGAGLGIIDIALKSENNIEYEFVPIDSDVSFYIFKVQVSKNQI
ncbi:MAG: SiaB family protein kinase [Bacteroidetes bacterium]|nr:SiaB family protein kinase [Bacteroidota bacterium]